MVVPFSLAAAPGSRPAITVTVPTRLMIPLYPGRLLTRIRKADASAYSQKCMGAYQRVICYLQSHMPAQAPSLGISGH